MAWAAKTEWNHYFLQMVAEGEMEFCGVSDGEPTLVLAD